MKKINHWLYHDKYFAFFHWMAGAIIMGIISFLIIDTGIISLGKITLLVNPEVISLSATIAGFELAGVALLISLNGNKKFQSIKDIGSDKTVYKLFFHSIILFTVSLIFMLADTTMLIDIPQEHVAIKEVIEYLSVILFSQGFVFFLSSMRMLILIFK